jgi:putative ABC transport system permease protein
MFWRILKKDLKRKKTMNIILLLFVVLCSMFAAASVNNIIAVVGGLDYYFEKAELGDYFIIERSTGGEDTISKILKHSENVSGYKTYNVVNASCDDLKTDSGKLMEFSNIALICDINNTKQNFFGMDNEVITDVEKGKVYITGSVPKREGVKIGERFYVELGDTKLLLEVAGFAKDALLGSEMMGNPRLLINSADFETLTADETIHTYSCGHVYDIDTDNAAALESELNEQNGMLFSGDRDLIKMTYIMNMLVAAIILVVSAGLLIVSFVVLRFTIRFTIAEEFREIGVMKAIGLNNSSIRMLYLVKYLGITLAGAVIGYFGSVPFGNLLLKSVSENMVLGNDNGMIISVVCCIAVVLIIMLFGWSSTRRIEKLSAIDAVRSGQTGERFRKRSLLSLGKSKFSSTGFLALNDVTSEPKQYGILTAVFAICTALVMILAVTANTLDSGSLLYLLSITESDVYMNNSTRAMEIIAGAKTIRETEDEIVNILAENDMPGNVYLEAWYKLPVTAKNGSFQVNFLNCMDTKTTDYDYTDGSAPIKPDEIAVTKQISEKLGAEIGDRVTVNIGGEKREFIITAYFQCFNNLGECARFHEDVSIPDSLMTSSFAYQINFDDHPDKAVIEERIEKLKDIFDNQNIFDTKGFVKDCMGVGDMIAAVKNLVLMLSLIIIILLAVLMERSFISKERSEIALLKAVGFDSGSVILYHTMRFGITVIIAIVTASALLMPLTKLIIDPIFGMMGAIGNIEYQFNVLEIFGAYPVIIFCVTVLSAALTALYTKAIKSSDTASIE